MPAGHSEAELDLALRVARHLGSGELYVLWREGSEEPVGAELVHRPHPEPPLSRGLALMGAVLEAAAAVLGRGVSRLA